MEQLQAYQDLLATTGVDWGLIGPREVERLWERHIDNSLAVTEDRECLPAAATVLDEAARAVREVRRRLDKGRDAQDDKNPATPLVLSPVIAVRMASVVDALRQNI